MLNSVLLEARDMDSVPDIVDYGRNSSSTAMMSIDSKKIHLASLSVLPGLNATKNFEKEEMVNIYRREEQFKRLRKISDTGEGVRFSNACWKSFCHYIETWISQSLSGRLCPKKS